MTHASTNSYPKRVAKPGRVDLMPEEFNNLIEDQGIMVRIIPAVLCPNRTGLYDTNHKLDCPLCFGDEVIDIRCKAIEDWAYVQGIKLDKNFEVQGVWDVKDAQITVRAGVRLYYAYKIEIIDFSSVFNQLLNRGIGDTDRVRYNPAPDCDTPYYLVDSAGINYELNIDYKISDYQIRWLGINRPATGKLYSFTYPVLPTFRVVELIHENRYYYKAFRQSKKTPVQLPQQAIIKLDFLSKGSGSNIERTP